MPPLFAAFSCRYACFQSISSASVVLLRQRQCRRWLLSSAGAMPAWFHTGFRHANIAN